MSNTNNATGAAIGAAGKLVDNVYSDVAGPAARRVGSALDTLFKVGLSPVALLDWGFERSKEWLSAKLEERLAQTPLEFQQHPPSQIAIPILLAIAASSESEDLRSLYAELLLKVTDSRTEGDVHPSYVTVLGQLTPQEALVFISFRTRESDSLFIDQPRAHRHLRQPSIEAQFRDHCESLGLQTPTPQFWLDNFLRLRLVELNTYTDAVYIEPDYDRPRPSVDTKEERHLTITEYGAAFLEACAPPSTT
jgi:hypothetical protein